jgi:hypothetical protein
MSPMPIASVTFAPQPSSSLARNAGSPPPARRPRAHGARSSRAGPCRARRPLEQVGGVGRREHGGLGLEQLDRAASGAPCSRADRDVAQPILSKASSGGAGDERARVVGRDDALSGTDARRCVAPRRAGHPVVEVVLVRGM